MTRRRVALVCAGIIGFAAAGLAAARAFEPPPRHDMHQRYRVAFDLPPVEAALWFATRYPEYFTSGEDGLDAWLDSLDPRDRDFVLAMGQTLTWAWVEQELSGISPRDPQTLARQTTIAVRQQTLNQLEVNVDHYPEVEEIEFNAYIGAPDFAAGVFARLVRGVSNCEGQNHFLALLLEAGLGPQGLGWSSFTAQMTATPDGHELVVVRELGLGSPIYVDAWSNLPAFSLDPARPYDMPLLAELGDSPPPVLENVASRAPRTADMYGTGDRTTVEMLSDRHAPTKEVDLSIQPPKLDPESLARIDDPWRLYLYARILHIYRDPRAADVYRLVKERDCGEHGKPRTFLCAASTLLLERVED